MSDQERLSGSKSMALRPLSKGMLRHLPTRGIPIGGFLDLSDFVSTSRGLKRRVAFDQYTGTALGGRGPLSEPDQILSMEAVEDSVTGGHQLFAFGRDWIYNVSGAGYTEVYRKHTAGTVSASSTTVLGTGSTAWITSHIKAGDIIKVDPAGTPQTRTITSVTGEAALAVDTEFSPALSAKSYEIYRKLNAGGPETLDVQRNPNRLIIASPGNELWKLVFGSTSVSEFASAYASATGPFSARATAYWRDRVYAICEDDGSDNYQRQRLRWTALLDDTDFSDAVAYLDMIYEASPGMRLIPLGNLLVLMFGDAIYLGRPTNIPDLPVQFEKMNTGGIGLFGQRAVTTYLDGMFFVGQDNIYVLSNSGIEPIGDAIVMEAVGECLKPGRIQVMCPPRERQVWFGFPKASDVMEEVFIFDVMSRSWSRFGSRTYMLSAPWFIDVKSWDDWTTEVWTDDSDDVTWASDTGEEASKTLYVESNGLLWRYAGGDGTTDPDGSVITAMIESGDFDLDAPDEVKLFTRLGMKVREATSARTTAIVFRVEISTNEGVSWHSKGELRIRPGYREGSINFRATGSTFRFRLTTASAVSSYTVEEIVLDWKGGGKEVPTRTQSE